MAKFDFNTSRYARLWGKSESDARLLTTVVNDENIIGVNTSWYLTQGSIDPSFTPVDSNGLATFTVRERALKAAPMADLRAPLGDAIQADAEGVNMYSASIPDFTTRKFVDTAMSLADKQKRYEAVGNDEEIMKQWVKDITWLRASMDGTMNWLTAQLMTKGFINYTKIGRGVYSPIHKADIPADNFCKAGEKVWTDPQATIITYMQEIEDKYRQKWGWSGAMKWQMTKNFFLRVFMKNQEVLDKVNEFRTLQDLVSVSFSSLNQDIFNNAWEQIRLAFGLSRIEMVEEKEFNSNHEGESFVHGWDDKYVVLRPEGDAVRFMRKQILDETYAPYLNDSTQRSLTSFNGGLGTLVNTVTPNGLYKQWETVVWFSCVPALVEFTKHVIVDTSSANG